MLKIYCCDAIYLLNGMKNMREEAGMVMTDPMNTDDKDFNLKWLSLCYDILEDGRCLCSFCGPATLNDFIKHAVSVGFTHIQTFEVFNKLKNKNYPCCVFIKGDGEVNTFVQNTYEDEEPVKDFPVESQKSVALIKDIVKTFTNEGDLVVDPFVGSGTTAKACEEINRSFKGCEKNLLFCAVARKRLGFGTEYQTGK